MSADDIYMGWRLVNLPLATLMAMCMLLKVGRIWNSSTIDVKLACIGMALYGMANSALSLYRFIVGFPTDWGVMVVTIPILLMLVSALIPPRRDRSYG